MFLGRAAVGIGEATYAPAATALISERFPREQRGRVLGVFQLGMVLGGAVGMIVGGIVAQRFGWRASFFVVGLPGLVLTALVLVVAEGRGARHVEAEDRATHVGIVRDRARSAPGAKPAVIWIVVCGVLTTFFTGAVIFWGPKYILRTFYGGDTAFTKRVSMSFGLIAVVALAAGTMVGFVPRGSPRAEAPGPRAVDHPRDRPRDRDARGDDRVPRPRPPRALRYSSASASSSTPGSPGRSSPRSTTSSRPRSAAPSRAPT